MNRQIKIGVGSYTFAWAIGVPGYDTAKPMSAFNLIEKAKELKADIVQFADNMPLHKYSDKELAELLSFARERSIEIEVGAKGLTTDKLREYIRIASLLNSNLLRFVIDENEYEPSIKEVVKIIEPFISILENQNIYLAIENHDRLKSREFIDIIESCDSNHVGICLDTVNSLGVPEGTEEVISTLYPYTLNLHIKDFTIERLDHKMGFKVEGTPAGQGMLGIPNLLQKLNTTGRCKTAILELWTPLNTSLQETVKCEDEWAHKSMDYLLNQLDY